MDAIDMTSLSTLPSWITTKGGVYSFEEVDRLMVYAYQKHIATKMRHGGFKFRPVFRQNNDQNRPTLNKCDYQLQVGITDRKLLIEIVL